jgi:DNA-binding IclR family transcriptional regulator
MFHADRIRKANGAKQKLRGFPEMVQGIPKRRPNKASPGSAGRAGEMDSLEASQRPNGVAAKRGVAAVNRAIKIMRAFTDEADGFSLSEISQRTGLYASTVLRLSESLEGFGLLERGPNGQFRLGSELIRLGELAKRTRRSSDDILWALRHLTEQTGESATYYVRQGNHRLALFRVDSPRSVRDNIRAGDTLPLDRGAGGHVLRSEKARSKGAMNDRFKPIVSRGERDPEVGAVAGPIYSGEKLEGALSVSGPLTRLTEAKIREISRVLVNTCETLTKRLS